MIKRGYSVAGGPATPEHVGTVTKYSADVNPGFVSGSSLDISSIDIQAGDIGIIAFAFGASEDGQWSWGGDIDFTQLINNTNTDLNLGGYVGYAELDGTETEIFTTGVTATAWDFLSIVFSVYRNVSFVNDISYDTGLSASLTPPDLDVTAGSIVVVTGHLDDDSVAMTAPTNYTLAGAINGGTASSCAMAYRTDHSTGTESPGAFGGTYNDDWFACTLELTPTDTRPYKLVDSKSVTVTDATSFDASGDFPLTDMTFQNGDLAFISIMSDEGGISSYSWGGDVDFATLNNENTDSPPHYQGWALLDGTEQQIHLTSGTTGQLQGGIIQLSIFRGAAYPYAKSTTAGSTLGNPSAPTPTTPVEGNMIVSSGYLDDDTPTLYATNGEQRFIHTDTVNTGTYSCSAIQSWRTVNASARTDTTRFLSSGDDNHAGKSFEFTDTKPAAHSVNVIGTATGTYASAANIDTYAEGLALPGGISTGDILYVQVGSSGDADSDFYVRVSGTSGAQNLTTIYRYSSTGFVSISAWVALNTTTLGSSPRVYLMSGGSNVDNNSLALAVFDGSSLSGSSGESATQYLASGMPQSLASTDWVNRGSLIISSGAQDGSTGALTAPTGYTLAVSANNGVNSSAAICYKTDIETGILAGGDDYGGGYSRPNSSTMIEFTSS